MNEEFKKSRERETKLRGSCISLNSAEVREVFSLESVRQAFWTKQRIGPTLETKAAAVCRHIEC